MKTVTRKQAIDFLVEDDVYIQASGDAPEYLSGVLRNGFKGYAHYTKKELTQEYNERSSEPTKIM